MKTQNQSERFKTNPSKKSQNSFFIPLKGIRIWVLSIITCTFISCNPDLFPPGSVHLQLPHDTLYVGSYARIPVTIDQLPASAFPFLKFSVLEGTQGGFASESNDRTFDPEKPEFLFIAGYEPGTYTLQAINKLNNRVVASDTFVVTVKDLTDKNGPSFVSLTHSAVPALGSAWGGGPAGPQNIGINPVRAMHRIAMIMVDTDEQRFPDNPAVLDSIRADWRNNIIDGINVNGELFSMRRYIREASQNTSDISMDIFGPYHLDGNWEEVGTSAGFVPHIQAAITAADRDVDFTQFHTILVVSQSIGIPGSPDQKFAWPTATVGEWNGWVSGDGTILAGAMHMPFDWVQRDGRSIYATATHEIGHNFGLSDLYAPNVPGRNAGSWDIMANESSFPGFSIANKMRLGWLPAESVRSFNFATAGTPVDETVTLSPTSAGNPAAGNFSGIEIRIADGLNYYFEYRHSNPALCADRNLPADMRILGTDVRSGSYEPVFSRPDVLLLPKIGSSAGAVLGNGQAYRETDRTTPIYPVEFIATASNLNNTADLRIQYGVSDRPDPSIRPWGGPPWQTADIEVRNERNRVAPEWFNIPWQGNPNDVIAKIKNNSNVDAPGVRVDFYVKNYNVGGTPEIYLGSDTRDVPANSTIEFVTGWVPPTNGHYCIIVRIPLYQIPGTTIVETTELNNVAQSNYDRFISPTASPAERIITDVEIGNPYPLPTRIYISVSQTNPLYRTYLEHKWLDLAPGEVRKIQVMAEYAGTLPEFSSWKAPDKKRLQLPNKVNIQTYIVNPYESSGHILEPLGGAEMEVSTGRKTYFQDFSITEKGISGQVLNSDKKRVSEGFVIITYTDLKNENELSNETVRLKDGTFFAPLKKRGVRIKAYYVPSGTNSDAYSNELTVE